MLNFALNSPSDRIDAISAQPAAPTTSAAVANAAETTLTLRDTWPFENSKGYSYDLALSLSDPSRFSDVRGKSHPNDSSIIVGKVCGDGPKFETAAVVFGRAVATATTTGFDTPIRIAIDLVFHGKRRYAIHPLLVAQYDSDGGACSDKQRIATNFRKPVATGNSVRTDFFVVIEGYFDEPDGDRQFAENAFVAPGITNPVSSADMDGRYMCLDCLETPLVR
ncbi:hypothetical protein ORI20_32295 [Mycobacterium sp. CVI_P3]|uniref:Uncharacterized protein n=1 Tax=Mycobacterium pinniadriaticum TaxID=2994102 RepID=A0ABT3SPC0_9MYCO|nr:hypothetical protein [Mycobacterium pinniadriaticum]MCX2934944.1 hypothetical protein [Mycobacterium pinniadriaticum]MCX2941366.1 hypothetical protein [Mycobacterium pinniadriaticum]